MALWLQVLIAACLAATTALVHGLGLVTMSTAFGLNNQRLEERDFDSRSLVLMGGAVVSLFLLHALEILLFAGFFCFVGAIGSLERSLFYSLSSYATLGIPFDLPDEWQLVGASEALTGFLMLGWSTAYLVNKFKKMRS